MGSLTDWHLKLWGEAVDASGASLLPMPNEDDDAGHDVISSTITASAKTTSISAGPQQTHQLATTHPSDHPHRPTKAPKPTGTEEEETTGTNVAQETTSSSWFSKLPSFGASKTAQIWIYGAVGLIILFCIGIGIYLYLVRRRRLRNDPHNNYEFELLDDEEREALNGSGEKGANGGRRSRRTRGGELYDAFAGGSDDEDEGEERDGDTGFQDYRDNRSRDRLPDDDEQYVVGDESDDDGDLHEKGASPPQRGAGGR